MYFINYLNNKNDTIFGAVKKKKKKKKKKKDIFIYSFLVEF